MKTVTIVWADPQEADCPSTIKGDARKYTVRRMDKEGDIDQPEPEGHDAFQKYETAAAAQKVARQLAEESRKR
jgi:hypothetical protein